MAQVEKKPGALDSGNHEGSRKEGTEPPPQVGGQSDEGEGEGAAARDPACMYPASLEGGDQARRGVQGKGGREGDKGDRQGPARGRAKFGILDVEQVRPRTQEGQGEAEGKDQAREDPENRRAAPKGAPQAILILAPEGVRHRVLHANTEAKVDEVKDRHHAHERDPKAVGFGSEVTDGDADLHEGAEDRKHLRARRRRDREPQSSLATLSRVMVRVRQPAHATIKSPPDNPSCGRGISLGESESRVVITP